ncbi:hypothetical protein ACTFIW_011318 [Dictyostelium discoideum]
MKNFYFFIILIFFISNVSSESLEDLEYENLELLTFINDCNYDTQRCLIFSNSTFLNSNSTCLVKHINEPSLNYSNIIGIVGYKDSILICGNHKSNNSLIVYSYNFTIEKQSFVYSDKVNITHVIQPQFSSSRYLIINHNHINLNISRHLHENSTRSISYFMNPKEFTKNAENYTEPTNAPLENDIQSNNYVSDENNSPALTVSFSTLTISLLLLSFINIL